MSIITVEFDNTLEKSKIIMPLLSSSKNEAGEDYSDTGMTDKAQTSVFGIQAPLIKINSTIIDFDAVHYFNLKSVDILPELTMVVEDRYGITTNIDNPTNDNEVRIQILPRFDNAYKKVDLTFYITSINVNGTLLRLTCAYKLPALTASQLKTYGEIDTYTLFKTVATETQLGFATNLAQLNDVRYSYCDNKSLLELLNEEIQYSDASEHINDWWVDLWDNINLVDVKERYEAVDSNDDIMIWVAGQINEITADNNTEPYQVPAVVNNLPHYNNSELFVADYSINNKPGTNLSQGTDRVYGIYEDVNKEYSDYFVQDGDVKKDVFIKYEYIGENYGAYNYLLAKQLRNAYLQKMNTDTIHITLQTPLLGLMRGHKLNFIRYTNDSMLENKMKNLEEAGIINRDVESNIPLSEYEVKSEEENTNGNFIIDKTVSGQYLILGVDITYTNNKWEYKLELSKPAITKTSILNNEE